MSRLQNYKGPNALKGGEVEEERGEVGIGREGWGGKN